MSRHNNVQPRKETASSQPTEEPDDDTPAQLPSTTAAGAQRTGFDEKASTPMKTLVQGRAGALVLLNTG